MTATQRSLARPSFISLMSVNVLIVGAGPTGLILALLLLQSGLTVRIVEKRAQFHDGERGAGIHPRTLELYKFLGILPEILNYSSTNPRNIKYFSSPEDGKPPRYVPFLEILENTPSKPMINGRVLGQNRHEKLLRDQIFKDYGVKVELGVELRSFEQHSDSVVTSAVRITDSQEVEETITADWLVGADGARSKVRKQMGLSFLGESVLEMTSVIGDIHVLEGSLKQEHPDGWTVWGELNSGAAMWMRPCLVPGQNLFNFFILCATEAKAVMISSSRDELIKAIRELTGRKDIEFGELVGMGVWRPNIRMVDKFSNGRAFVAGDAAHVHSPTGAQGMNSGIQDSFNLAWKLALVQQGLAPKSLLNSYSDERLPVMASILNKTTELFQKEWQVKPLSQGQTQTTMFRGFELRQFGINYRGSGIILDEVFGDRSEMFDSYRSGNDGTVRAGDRAPDAPGLTRLGSDNPDTIAIFELLNTLQHTAFIFPGSSADKFSSDMLECLCEYPSNTVKSVVLLAESSSLSSAESDTAESDTVLIDTKGYAYTHYGVSQDTPMVVIVRPDGYIGALVTSGGKGIRQYFAEIFS
ncbi:hypothetical protein D9757_006709 [Collybiopsis confluens]|uniref:FAD-binding domain-containing protein n=1 Tax=Collybiopsis confluens TaxID=2823264 RepID=A0A8H5HNN5_9AGAR|nr:hypothetical protein D9757_006709 [Collybiopsis confluens]